MNIFTQIPQKLNAIMDELPRDALPPTLESIYLFGSYARGEQTLSSDIDMALVHEACYTPLCRTEELFLKMHVEEQLPELAINFFSTNREKIDTETSPMNTNTNIRQEGRVLWQSTPIEASPSEI